MTLDNLSASTVEAVLSEALRPDAALALLGFVLRPPTPQKLEQVLGQLASEPPPHRLDLNIAYSSPAAFAAAVHEVVAHLDGSNLSPVYSCSPADVYDAEPSAVVPAALAALFVGNVALTWGHLCNGAGFAEYAGFVAWHTFGRCQAALRDAPGSPAREFFAEAVTWARNRGKLGAGATPFIPAANLADWLRSTCFREPCCPFLYENGAAGTDRRLQCGRDRDTLSSGTPEQRADVLAELAGKDPLRAQLNFIWQILGPACAPPDVRGYLGQLSRALVDEPEITDPSRALVLNAKCKNYVHALTSAAVSTSGSAHSRVAAVIAAVGNKSAPGGSSSGAKPSVAAVVAQNFASALSAQVGSPAWRALEQALGAELMTARPNNLAICKALMNSPILAARRFALGHSDAGVLDLMRLSPVLSRAKSYLKDWQEMLSRMLVVDMQTLTLPAGVTDLRLPAAVTNALKRGAFNEICVVEDLLRPKIAADQSVKLADMFVNGRVPANHATTFEGGLLHADAAAELDDVAVRISTLLGIPRTVPPAALPPAPMAGQPVPPPPPQLPWITLSDFFSTVNATRLSIAKGDQNFAIQRRKDLVEFVDLFWKDASDEFQRIIGDDNPVGRVSGSVVDMSGAAVVALAKLQRAIAADQARRVTDPEVSSMLGWWEANKDTLSDPAQLRRLMQSTTSRGDGAGGSADLRGPVRSRSPSRTREAPSSGDRRSRRLDSVSPSREHRGHGSMYERLVRHSTDGESFWFVKDGTEERASPAYDYATLERITGFTRVERDFPVLLSIKKGDAKMEVCGHKSDPKHASMSAAAHLQVEGLLEKARQHFRQPPRE